MKDKSNISALKIKIETVIDENKPNWKSLSNKINSLLENHQFIQRTSINFDPKEHYPFNPQLIKAILILYTSNYKNNSQDELGKNIILGLDKAFNRTKTIYDNQTKNKTIVAKKEVKAQTNKPKSLNIIDQIIFVVNKANNWQQAIANINAILSKYCDFKT